MKKLKKKIEELNHQFDINNKYPGYVNKKIFRVAMLLIALFIIFLFFVYGTDAKWVYIECQSRECSNPYITCQQDFISSVGCSYYLENECAGQNCNSEIIKKGEYIGEKPPEIVRYAHLLVLLVVISAVAVNHILWRMKQ